MNEAGGGEESAFADSKVMRLGIFLAMMGLGYYWFTVAMAPWQGFLNSDHAVPYEMTLQPWIKQDFYFWRAGRFGSLYVVFWKGFAKQLFGTTAQPFYLGHCLVFFAGLSLWLMALTRPLTRLLFLYLLLPLHIMAVVMYVMPGHLYGMSFFLLGAAAFVLTKTAAKPGQAALLGAITGLAYWQHEPSGMLCAFLFAGDRLSGVDLRQVRAAASKLVRDNWAFLTTFVPLLIWSEVARAWSKQWGTPSHTGVVGWKVFTNGLKHILATGVRCYLNPIFGQCVLAVVVWLTLGVLVNRKRLHATSSSQQRLAWTAGSFCCAFFLTLFLFAANEWYVANDRDDRYFVFLLAPALFFALRTLETGFGSSLYRWVTVLLLFAATSQAQFNDTQGTVVSAANKKNASRDYEHALHLIPQLDAAGCKGYMGAHWDSRLISPLTDGRLVGQGLDAEMHPRFFEMIRAMPAYCIRRSIDPGFIQRMSAGKTCLPFADLLRCS